MFNWLKRQPRWRICLPIVFVVLGLFVGFAPEALAKYRPPKRSSPPKVTTSNTTRDGCDSKVTERFTVLVPYSHVGQTSVSRPTFAWWMPEHISTKLQFRLFRSNGEPLYQTELQSQPGVMKVSLPTTERELQRGQRYRWQVAFLCNPNDSLTRHVVAAEIQVVDPPSSLLTQLANAKTPQQRVDLYGEAGLWYDALATALQASRKTRNSPIVVQLIDELVQSEPQAPKSWSDRFKPIQTISQQQQQ